MNYILQYSCFETFQKYIFLRVLQNVPLFFSGMDEAHTQVSTGKVCFICGNAPHGRLRCLITEKTNPQASPVLMTLRKCFAIDIPTKHDIFRMKICVPCMNKLEATDRFQDLVESAVSRFIEPDSDDSLGCFALPSTPKNNIGSQRTKRQVPSDCTPTSMKRESKKVCSGGSRRALLFEQDQTSNDSSSGQSDALNDSSSGQSDALNDSSSGQSDALNDSSSGQSDALNDSSSGQSDALNDSSSGQSDALNDSSSGQSDALNDSSSGQSDALNDSSSGQSDALNDSSSGQSDVLNDSSSRQSEVLSLTKDSLNVFTTLMSGKPINENDRKVFRKLLDNHKTTECELAQAVYKSTFMRSVEGYVIREINTTMVRLCSEKTKPGPSVLRTMANVEDLEGKDILTEATLELRREQPFLCQLLTVLCDPPGGEKQKDYTHHVIAMVYGILMYNRCRNLNAIQKLNTAAAIRYHVNNELLEIFHRCGLTMAKSYKLGFLERLGKFNTIGLVRSLRNKKKGKVTVDNIDWTIKTRQMRLDSKDNYNHFAASTYYVDRVLQEEIAHLSTVRPPMPEIVNTGIFFLTADEERTLKRNYGYQVIVFLIKSGTTIVCNFKP